MIKVDISGMADGEYEFDFKIPVKTLDNSFEEFIGNVLVNLSVIRLSHRYTLIGKAECVARLICDRTLKEFDEIIKSDFNLVYKADTKLFMESQESQNNENEIIIREDTKYIDISSEVLEHLALNLPMKRIAPEFRDKDILDIYPELNNEHIEKNTIVDERWSKLKDFKIN